MNGEMDQIKANMAVGLNANTRFKKFDASRSEVYVRILFYNNTFDNNVRFKLLHRFIVQRDRFLFASE
ncbi:hypothetical protein H5410_012247 [Solanum commersonii]|uniref:Uncharacterized protein n=1 Tax=Solanum commersonii TaxID=4109 RepID=A0A9J6AQZ7_SOLCO|nr:hypothetical protein H5410_012247 [Solanum commersonii]